MLVKLVRFPSCSVFFMLQTPVSTRNSALDLLRATAIFLVFVYHYRIFVSPEQPFGILAQIGWIGVDLFFVLSGYLITAQLLKARAEAGPHSQLSFKAFYLRRALRTWPAFWLVLAVYMLWGDQLGGREPPPLWMFLTFTQNFNLQPGTQFSHAWSLCVEEQFYLILPILVWLACKLGTHKRQFWALVVLAMVSSWVYRFVLWCDYGRADFGQLANYYPWLYYGTLARVEEFIPGMAVAYLQYQYPAVFARITAHGKTLLLLSVALLSALALPVRDGYYQDGFGYLPVMTVFGYTWISWSFGLLLLAALSPSSGLERVKIPGVAKLALWSYSLYLTHKAVGHLGKTYLPLLVEQPAPWLLLLVVSVVSLLVAALLYQLVEQPGMALRQRFDSRLFVTTKPT